jgi:hypothetical protein
MLRELQTDFAAAILREDARRVLGAIAGEGLIPAARVQVYRHHVFTSLTASLSATYPAVRRLVGHGFFAFAVDAYIRQGPPAGPCLFEYDATFADFLGAPVPGGCGPAGVGDERCAARRGHGADRTREVGGRPVGRLTFQLDPSAVWLRSPWPVDRIWQANQSDADDEVPVDMGAGGAQLEIRRQADDVVTMTRLAPAEFAFRSALGAGASLETAADTAMTEDPGFDLTEALRALLGEALLVGFTTDRAKGDFQ